MTYEWLASGTPMFINYYIFRNFADHIYALLFQFYFAKNLQTLKRFSLEDRQYAFLKFDVPNDFRVAFINVSTFNYDKVMFWQNEFIRRGFHFHKIIIGFHSISYLGGWV